ncbi:MAG TPA: DUF1800 domain-containing protein, partial [Thermoanaerobaculia bacterium]|nr:DUF1800 domain-containing protein [Thermoanaerobaculia bacterium]
MRLRRPWALSVTAIAVGFGTLALAASPPHEKSPLTAREKAIHVLNRLGFGPRPGEVEKVLGMGIHSWIEQQLHPERIPDPIVQGKLRDLPTLSMSTADLFEKFERPLREARRERQLQSGKDGSAKGAETAEVDFEKMRDQFPPEKRPRRIIEELSASRLLAAAYSERQLNEVMVDFWMNHFNVFAAKGLDRIFVTSFERDTIRPNIWGRFEDLLMATAKSPAMLFYLDNAQSTADEANRPHRRAFAAGRWALLAEMRGQQRKAGGLNENYARELMELHTLGVDGGYTQKDVTELARVLTGWSIDRRGGQPGAFVFRPAVHDVGTKTVLGNRFSGGGMEEGEEMIHFLARHPSTAHHIAFQLCQRLVADDPPRQLVERVAKKLLATDGDLRQTVQSIVESPEFFDPQ